MTLRTDDLTLDKDFEVQGAVTKTWVDGDGYRYIQGVISGVDEDKDGERVSEDCIKSMVSQVQTGKVVATSSHQQDWFTTFGEATEAFHDGETGEMVGKVRLPPEGQDPVADKAWLVTKRGGLGWSIGGKLVRAYFEKTDVGKKRKVLDQVALRHFCLTEKPAYAASFAEVVAKTFEGDPPDDDFVEKTDTGVAGEPGGDSKTGDRNAGTSSGDNRLKTDEPEKDDTDEKGKLPKSPPGRHLACPNCGHEFAADLPADRNESTPQEDLDDDEGDPDDKQANKTASEEIPMLKDTLDELRSLVGDVAKTDPEPDPEVAKTSTDLDGIVAKAVLETNERLDTLESTLATAFETIAKSHKQLVEIVRSAPVGRKSLARRPTDGIPHEGGHSGEAVEKTTDELIAESDGPIEAFKVLNAARGIS